MSLLRAAARVRRGALAAALVAALGPRVARAQSTTVDREAEARAYFDRAMEAWRRSDCLAAAEDFTRAMAAAPHPHTRYNLARAQECAGGAEVARAIESYEAFLAETTDSADRREVEERLRSLRARPVEVLVTSDPLEARVRVDDEPAAGVTPLRLRLAPGPHVLELAREGRRTALRRVVVSAGTPADVHVELEAAAPAPTPTPAPVDRVATRRLGRPVSGRAALVAGFAVPRDRPTFAVGIEAGAFVLRSLQVQAHALWIDTDGAPFVVGGDVGWVFVLDEVDLGVFVSGSLLSSCQTGCREEPFSRDSEQFVGGFAVRADLVLHPRLSLGLFGRAAWRNFDLSDSQALLPSGGVAVNLLL